MENICPTCGKVFYSGRLQGIRLGAKFCSHRCLKKSSGLVGIPSGTIGAISELIVCADLLRRGYIVYRSVSQCAFCDLIIFKDSKVIKVEVKTLKKPTLKGIHQEVDIIACYSRKDNKIVYFNKELKQTKI